MPAYLRHPKSSTEIRLELHTAPNATKKTSCAHSSFRPAADACAAWAFVNGAAGSGAGGSAAVM